MPKHVYMAGGGHAGSSAAIAAARAKQDLGVDKDEVEIHVIDKNPYQTIKPRLYEYELEEVIIPYSKFLPEAGVHFHRDTIESINTAKKQIAGKNDCYYYDALILSSGSEVNADSKAYNINSYEASRHFQTDLFGVIDKNQDKQIDIAVLGAGFTGIELATELPNNIKKHAEDSKQEIPDYKIFLFNHGKVGASLGENPKPTIIKALDKVGIQKISHVTIKHATKTKVEFEDDEGNRQTKTFDLVVNTLGQKPNPLVDDIEAEKDKANRLKVNSHLQVHGFRNLFAAGDLASAYVDEENLALMTCQQGRPQGRHAGYNAVAFLTNNKMVDYQQPFYLTVLDLGEYGSVYTEGWDREVIFKGPEAEKFKKHINQERIYPPTTGNPDDLYKAGKLVFEAPRKTIADSKFK